MIHGDEFFLRQPSCACATNGPKYLRHSTMSSSFLHRPKLPKEHFILNGDRSDEYMLRVFAQRTRHATTGYG